MAVVFIRVTMPDGSAWDVPAEQVADARSRYYAERDQGTTYQEEYDYTINDDDELIDWATNNMNWSDVARSAVMAAAPPEADYEDGWCNGDKVVIRRTQGEG